MVRSLAATLFTVERLLSAVTLASKVNVLHTRKFSCNPINLNCLVLHSSLTLHIGNNTLSMHLSLSFRSNQLRKRSFKMAFAHSSRRTALPLSKATKSMALNLPIATRFASGPQTSPKNGMSSASSQTAPVLQDSPHLTTRALSVPTLSKWFGTFTTAPI